MPDPANCWLEARPVEEFLAISAGATLTGPAPGSAAGEVPLSDSADVETVAGVNATT